MQEKVIFELAGMGFAILFLTLVVVVIVSLIKVAQAKVQSDKEEMYEKLARDAVEAQKDTARLNEKIVEEMAELKKRLSSIERILKEVE